jgi:hypothetical protein
MGSFLRPRIDNQFVNHFAEMQPKYALAQMLIIFRIAFMAVVGVSGVSNIDCVNDVLPFIKSKAAVSSHVYLLSEFPSHSIRAVRFLGFWPMIDPEHAFIGLCRSHRDTASLPICHACHAC